MKKIIFALLLMIPLTIQAKEFEVYCCNEDDISTGGPFLEDESVRFEFDYSMYLHPKFLTVRIINKTDSRLYVEWENARISDSQICFRTDNAFSFNNPKPDEVIHAGSESTKEIGDRQYFTYNNVYMFNESSIKSHGESVRKVILPIRYSSGKVIDYKVYVCVRYKQ